MSTREFAGTALLVVMSMGSIFFCIGFMVARRAAPVSVDTRVHQRYILASLALVATSAVLAGLFRPVVTSRIEVLLWLFLFTSIITLAFGLTVGFLPRWWQLRGMELCVIYEFKKMPVFTTEGRPDLDDTGGRKEVFLQAAEELDSRLREHAKGLRIGRIPFLSVVEVCSRDHNFLRSLPNSFPVGDTHHFLRSDLATPSDAVQVVATRRS